MLLDPEDIPANAVEIMAPAFEYSQIDTAERWIDLCRKGYADFWVSDDGKYHAVTQIIEGKGGLIFHMVASCGEFRQSLVDECEGIARAHGCTKAITEGRPGWARVLRGYKTTNITLEKEL